MQNARRYPISDPRIMPEVIEQEQKREESPKSAIQRWYQGHECFDDKYSDGITRPKLSRGGSFHQKGRGQQRLASKFSDLSVDGAEALPLTKVQSHVVPPSDILELKRAPQVTQPFMQTAKSGQGRRQLEQEAALKELPYF